MYFNTVFLIYSSAAIKCKSHFKIYNDNCDCTRRIMIVKITEKPFSFAKLLIFFSVILTPSLSAFLSATSLDKPILWSNVVT